MKSTRFRLIVGILAGLLLTSFVVARSVRAAETPGNGRFGGHMIRFFSDYLDLTDAQQAQVKQILCCVLLPTHLGFMQRYR